jgi:heme/copper-type cytochrome/quinol oxidase subunit 2
MQVPGRLDIRAGETVMSSQVWDLIESLFIIALITAGIIGYALVLARREDRETRQASDERKLRAVRPGEVRTAVS